MRIKDIALTGIMGALLVIVQVALSFLPNIELVSLLIIIFTLVFEWKALPIIYVFVAVEGLIYGFGPWWINYLYIWPILFILVMQLHKLKSAFIWAIICGAYGLSFGALCSLVYFITGGIASGFAYWVQGIPYDLLHGAGNFAVALLLFKPLYFVLNKLHKQTFYH